MGKPLSALIVEDVEDDALLMLRHLKGEDYDVDHARVDTAEAMRTALGRKPWNVILCDYKLPKFGVQEALDILRDSGADIPFLVVTGTIGEERAADLMRAGARDMILKDNLARLVPAIEREMRQARERREKKRAVGDLHASERRFKHMAESASDWFWEMGPDLRFTYHSERYFEITGFRPADEVGIQRTRYVDPEDLEGEADTWDRHFADLEARKPFRDFEYSFKTADGRTLHACISGIPVFDDNGAFLGYRGTGTDITDRKRAEDELAARNAHIRGILDNAINGIITIDEHGIVDSFNPAAERMFGYSSDEVIGCNIKALMTMPDADRHDDYIRNYLRTGQGKIIGKGPREVTARRRDGKEFPADLAISEFRLGEKRLFIGMLVDITERKTTERQLQQAQKMEAVGQLTGGIAHDFNNILGVILGNLQLLDRRVKDEPRLGELVAPAIAATRRGADLTRQLLAFSRRQDLDPRVIDVNEFVPAMDTLLRRTLGGSIEIETALGDGLGRVKVDPTQLEAAILNLAINARDAMPGGGRLMIETSNEELDDTYVKRNPFAKLGPHVCISVSDNGCGIPAGIRENIFEPFFTTKEVGKGTGLGLSMVFGFVKQSGGHINVYSEEGQGTRFRLYFPRTDEAAMAMADKPDLDDLPTGTETILLVEDNPEFRKTATLLLEEMGYTVVGAADGPGAVKILEARQDLDLLFTDMVMPGGLNGHQLAERARELRPGLKVLLTSGYPRNSFSEGRHFPLLSKPYTNKALARAVRAALDGQAKQVN